jgi:hypothetical protein
MATSIHTHATSSVTTILSFAAVCSRYSNYETTYLMVTQFSSVPRGESNGEVCTAAPSEWASRCSLLVSRVLAVERAWFVLCHVRVVGCCQHEENSQMWWVLCSVSQFLDNGVRTGDGKIWKPVNNNHNLLRIIPMTFVKRTGRVCQPACVMFETKRFQWNLILGPTQLALRILTFVRIIPV